MHAYMYTYMHTLYLNIIRFKAQSLWGRVKFITNEHRSIFKTGIALLTKYPRQNIQQDYNQVQC